MKYFSFSVYIGIENHPQQYFDGAYYYETIFEIRIYQKSKKLAFELYLLSMENGEIPFPVNLKFYGDKKVVKINSNNKDKKGNNSN
jgi:hypothetical protein